MKARIAVIGASDLQLPLILKAREMGYETHVFAWAAGDPGEEAADVFYPVSITETDRITEICRSIRPAGVVSIASDLAAITVTRVANALGLPANPPETAVIAANKYEMRKAFQRAGIPVPRFTRVSAEEDPAEAYRMRLPLIVKPTDRSGSRGVCLVTDFSRLRESVEKACAVSFEHRAIIEEFIEGEEYSCECFSREGKHDCLTITKKYTTGAPHFVEYGHIQPSGLDEAACAKVREQVFRALDALHIRCGASHSEFRIQPGDGEIRLIEIGARMGGGCIGSDLVRLTTGGDYVEMVIRAATGQEVPAERGEHAEAAAVRFVMNRQDYDDFLSLKRDHPEAILRMNDIRYEDREVTDSSLRFGFYIAAGPSSEELRRLLRL